MYLDGKKKNKMIPHSGRFSASGVMREADDPNSDGLLYFSYAISSARNAFLPSPICPAPIYSSRPGSEDTSFVQISLSSPSEMVSAFSKPSLHIISAWNLSYVCALSFLLPDCKFPEASDRVSCSFLYRPGRWALHEDLLSK